MPAVHVEAPSFFHDMHLQNVRRDTQSKAAEVLAMQSKKNRGHDHQNEPSSAANLPAQIP